ncbi:hypothetical protein [Cryptosporangium aurantiacum]|uniref:Uncharacterized protein n=1 Tax=Cryptosporangium aurantiacum TaxID=134849 RepID=A0A1M7TUJ9_9ACTN|nr:hypothetical protein [Cryptosporangium aurantiacum]SHN74429.1 hypothetical protein SAMN05443668_10779 [Cryptosporangium aurantiacum]
MEHAFDDATLSQVIDVLVRVAPEIRTLELLDDVTIRINDTIVVEGDSPEEIASLIEFFVAEDLWIRSTEHDPES